MLVITPYFNPQKYKSLKNNHRIFAKRLLEQGANLITVELTFGDEPPELTDSDLGKVVFLKSKSVMWQKEQIINYVINNHMGDEVTFAWIDCDVLFKDGSWIKRAEDKLEEADIIVLGPGSLYTSIIPNLIIKGLSEAIVKSPAYKIYVCNMMTQPGETEGFSASDHIKVLTDHSLPQVINACVINNANIPESASYRYKKENSYPVIPDVEKIKEMGYKVVATDLVGVNDYVRHDSKKLTQGLIKLIESKKLVKR